ncbi:5-bromo-4-chloroindolyl phosphate hydrolysis family protein [Nitratifractor sp.]
MGDRGEFLTMDEIRTLAREFHRRTGAMLLYVMMFPLLISVVISLVGGNGKHFLLKLGGFVLLGLAATAETKGIRQELRYEETEVTRAPAVPWKLIGALLTGATIFYLGFVVGGKGALASLFVAAVGAAGVLLYYGLDPREDKLPDLEGMDAEFLLRSLAEARDSLERIRAHNREIHDLTLHRGVEYAVEKAERILGAIEAEPAKLRSARKFLVVYIDGVARVTEHYTELEDSAVDEETRQRLYRLLEDVQRRFDAELERLREDRRFDLDVQIDALQEQLK